MCQPISRKMFQKDQKLKVKARADGDLDKKRTECTPRKCFRCGYKNHQIAKFQNPPKQKEKRQKKVHSRKRGNCASKKIMQQRQ